MRTATASQLSAQFPALVGFALAGFVSLTDRFIIWPCLRTPSFPFPQSKCTEHVHPALVWWCCLDDIITTFLSGKQTFKVQLQITCADTCTVKAPTSSLQGKVTCSSDCRSPLRGKRPVLYLCGIHRVSFFVWHKHKLVNCFVVIECSGSGHSRGSDGCTQCNVCFEDWIYFS